MASTEISTGKGANLATANPSTLIPDTADYATKEDILLVISKLVLLKTIKMDKDKMVAITNELLTAKLKRKQLLSAYYSVIEQNTYGSLNIEHFLTPEVRDTYRARQIAESMVKESIENFQNKDYEKVMIENAKMSAYFEARDRFFETRDAMVKEYEQYLNENVFKMDSKLFQDEEKKYSKSIYKR